MTYTEILYETRERVATITLDRPDRLNARTRTVDAEVRAAVHAVADDPDHRVRWA